MDFKDYINFLYTNGLLGLGKIANPQTNKAEMNLDLVKFTIDVLELIKDKTQGNLTNDEEMYLLQVISTLQLNYVEEIKKSDNKEEKKD